MALHTMSMTRDDHKGQRSIDNIILVPLRERRDLLDACVELLNSQWPRSKTARMRSLEQSFMDGEVPTSLLLLEKVEDKDGNKKERVIGHSRISPVVGDKEKCFVESVVIANEHRGKGYGKLIMDLTEAYAKGTGIKVMHLTTHDQQGFYEKLGYEFCDPIVVFSGSSPDVQRMLLAAMKRGNDIDNEARLATQNCAKESSQDATNQVRGSELPLSNAMGNMSLASRNRPPLAPPPPPPPPPPAFPCQNTNERVQILFRPDGSHSAWDGHKMHMRKVLT